MLARLGSLSDVSANCLRGTVHNWSARSGADDDGDGGKMMLAKGWRCAIETESMVWGMAVWGRDNRPRGLMGREEMKSHSAGKKKVLRVGQMQMQTMQPTAGSKSSSSQGSTIRVERGKDTLYQPGAVWRWPN
jgi:hypothetical protein